MAKHDRVRVRTNDGTTYSLVARKSGGRVEVDPDDEEAGRFKIMEVSSNGTTLRSVEIEDRDIQAVIRDRAGDPTMETSDD